MALLGTDHHAQVPARASYWPLSWLELLWSRRLIRFIAGRKIKAVKPRFAQCNLTFTIFYIASALPYVRSDRLFRQSRRKHFSVMPDAECPLKICGVGYY